MNSHKQGNKKGNSKLIGIMLVSVLAMGVLSECQAADTWQVECEKSDFQCRLAEVDAGIKRLDKYLSNDDNFKLTGKGE